MKNKKVWLDLYIIEHEVMINHFEIILPRVDIAAEKSLENSFT